MTVDWWTLGLQAVNVLILVWLLSRLFWTPVAAAIDRRQVAAQGILDEAANARDEAKAAVAEVAATRAGLAAERDAMLAEATKAAAAAAKAAMDDATAKADALLRSAQTASARETDAARAGIAADAALLAVDIARKLLARLETGAVQTTFLGLLVEAIQAMSAAERQSLLRTPGGIDLVSAVALDPAAEAEVADAVRKALGGEADLHVLTDPDLIAGFELRTAHFVLRDSWQSDLEAILKDLRDAA